VFQRGAVFFLLLPIDPLPKKLGRLKNFLSYLDKIQQIGQKMA
jgi:hypothetical protein